MSHQVSTKNQNKRNLGHLTVGVFASRVVVGSHKAFQKPFLKAYHIDCASCVYVLCLVAHLCLTLCNPMDYRPSGSSVHGDSPGKNTRMGSHALLQGIFPTRDRTQVSYISGGFFYHLSHWGSPRILAY